MTDATSPFAVEEYRALRATIRERGTFRLAAVVLTFVAWAALALITALVDGHSAVVSLLPLAVLAAGFETVFAAHIGVERIGRYLQLRYEADADGPAWERTAMALPATAAPPGADALCSQLFVLAILLNAAIGATSALPPRVAVLLGAVLLHLGLLARVFQARRYASTQRASDLELLARTTNELDSRSN
jgi:hypothetical protein